MQLENIHSIYFVGIGGIGMSAIARYFNGRGVQVAGYDRTETPLTRALVAEGIEVRYIEEVDSLPKAVDLVVYTPAVPDSHAELKWFRANDYPVYKRSQVLGVISEGMRTIAIAGTHGKTTTSTLTTHLLREGGVDCNAFLGGVSRNFASNFVEGSSDWVVIEADEFDRSFLTLTPELATIMSMDADHLDIYGDEESLLATGFFAFAQKLKADGKLWVRAGLEKHFPATAGVSSFGIEEGRNQAQNLRVEDGYFVFDYVSDQVRIEGLCHPHPGRHNVENALAAITVALELGVKPADIAKGLLSFRGIGRRFEFHLRTEEVVYIDDYAHHPTELQAAIGAARELYPGRKLTGIFQPHLFTRTRDFVEGFAAALDELDELYLLDIYPAREEPIPGVTSQLIKEHMKKQDGQLLSKEEMRQRIPELAPDVLLTLGAGDIDTLVQPIKEHLTKKL